MRHRKQPTLGEGPETDVLFGKILGNDPETTAKLKEAFPELAAEIDRIVKKYQDLKRTTEF